MKDTCSMMLKMYTSQKGNKKKMQFWIKNVDFQKVNSVNINKSLMRQIRTCDLAAVQKLTLYLKKYKF